MKSFVFGPKTSLFTADYTMLSLHQLSSVSDDIHTWPVLTVLLILT